MILIIDQIDVVKMQITDTTTQGHVVTETNINARERLRCANTVSESSRLKLIADMSASAFTCAAPTHLRRLLRLEGFTEVEFVVPANDAEGMRLLPEGKIDIEAWDAPILMKRVPYLVDDCAPTNR